MIKQKNKLFIILSIIIFIIFIISMNSGYISLKPMEVMKTLVGQGDADENLILFHFRLPRIVISILIGVGLSLSGCIIQGITKNDLADPGILGINAGASLMVILYMMYFGFNNMITTMAMPIFAFVGALLSAGLIYFIASKNKSGFSKVNLVLTGVAIQAGISALTTILVIRLDETQLNFVTSWQAGSIWASNWRFVIALIPWFVILIPLVMKKSYELDLLNIGQDISRGLGMEVEKEERKLLLMAVSLSASCVAVGGNISFVGLLAPHLGRKLVGPRHKNLLPVSAFLGAILVLLADTIGRSILQPTEIPTGIIVAIIGTPYFLYLIKKGRK